MRRPEWIEDWHRANPRRVQRYAGRKRAEYWRNLGFTNLMRARLIGAVVRESSRNGYSDEMLVDCMVDLKRPPM
jgi:hypothetical protein